MIVLSKKLVKIGYSLGFIINKQIVKELNLKKGDIISIKILEK